jgi:hypothetical protein
MSQSTVQSADLRGTAEAILDVVIHGSHRQDDRQAGVVLIVSRVRNLWTESVRMLGAADR